MIKLQNILISVDSPVKDAVSTVAKKLHIKPDTIKSAYIYRRSVDVRKKANPCFCYTFVVDFFDKHIENKVLKQNKNAVIFKDTPYIWKKAIGTPLHRPIIIGSGPAGLFAALTLCKAGLPPIIIERGKPVEERTKDIDCFWENGNLNPYSNVQFGEGGAGTFSDGKLNTGIKDPRCRTVLEAFNEFGADGDILINARPHIGTDELRKVIASMRAEIKSLGGEYLFETTFEKPIIKQGKITEIICNQNGNAIVLPCSHLVIAIGNAARDTFETLLSSGIDITSKPFAVGMRIEHSQEALNTSQYGDNYSNSLPPLEYKLATHLKNGRGVYTFCMCPGGVVVNGASEENAIVTNGMSYNARNGTNANSALLVGVSEADFGSHPLAGVELQRKIERAAFDISGSYSAPCETLNSFLYSGENKITTVKPTIKPAPYLCSMDRFLPTFITDSVREALPLFDSKIKGFADKSAVLTAPETRSSSPVKIPRNDRFEANVKGVFPCGEGAGYAGGITSSAVDGIRCAEAIIQSLNIG